MLVILQMNKRYYGALQPIEEERVFGHKSFTAATDQEGKRDKKSTMEGLECRPSIDSSVKNSVIESLWENIAKATAGLESLESSRFVSGKRKEAEWRAGLARLSEEFSECRAAREVGRAGNQAVEGKLIDGIEAILEVTKSELLDKLVVGRGDAGCRDWTRAPAGET